VIVFRLGPGLVGSRQAGFRLWRSPQSHNRLHMRVSGDVLQGRGPKSTPAIRNQPRHSLVLAPGTGKRVGATNVSGKDIGWKRPFSSCLLKTST
jgi:hypothetical protein